MQASGRAGLDIRGLLPRTHRVVRLAPGRERERECVCVCVSVCVRKRDCVCLCARECVSMCVIFVAYFFAPGSPNSQNVKFKTRKNRLLKGECVLAMLNVQFKMLSVCRVPEQARKTGVENPCQFKIQNTQIVVVSTKMVVVSTKIVVVSAQMVVVSTKIVIVSAQIVVVSTKVVVVAAQMVVVSTKVVVVSAQMVVVSTKVVVLSAQMVVVSRRGVQTCRWARPRICAGCAGGTTCRVQVTSLTSLLLSSL